MKGKSDLGERGCEEMMCKRMPGLTLLFSIFFCLSFDKHDISNALLRSGHAIVYCGLYTASPTTNARFYA